MKEKTNIWKKYRIGNTLRGVIDFKARNVFEAWEIGRRKFNLECPASSDLGRSIILEQYNDEKVTLTTKWYYNQNKLPESERAYNNHKTHREKGWETVAYGMSGESIEVR